MDRMIEKALEQWRTSDIRLPLIVRGARQIGKSHTIEKFGKKHFDNLVVLNFELEPKLKNCFESLDPQDIINAIETIKNITITSGKTLLFLDEIQEEPQAILALRYFKEKMPKLHVIAAGSLLEFILNKPDFRMPVGRVQFLFMYPMSFQEFLSTMGYDKMATFIEQVTLSDNIPTAIHEELFSLLKQYLIVGGMPAVVKQYQKTRNYQQAQQLQTALLLTYRNDFGKYAKNSQHSHLQLIYDHLPGLVTQIFRYVNVSRDISSRELKTALQLLIDAGITTPVYATAASGLPLNALINEKRFKLLFLDTGLVNCATDLSAEILQQNDLLLINRGSLTEQFVGQELKVSTDASLPSKLFHWARDKAGSQAEVDYVINVDQNIFPIEVKSGKTGRLKSLQLFLQEKPNSPFGIRIAQTPLERTGNVQSVPLYLAGQLRRLLALSQ